MASLYSKFLDFIGIEEIDEEDERDDYYRDRDDRFDDSLLDELIGDGVLLLEHLLFGDSDGSFRQIPDHGVHVAPYVSDLCELGRLDLYERSVHQFGETPCDLCFTASGRLSAGACGMCGCAWYAF